MRIASLLHVPLATHGFHSFATRSKPLSRAKLHASPLNQNDGDPSMVAAASAASLCVISGDDPVLKPWCEEAMNSEIPQFYEIESDYNPPEHDMEDEDGLVWKDVPFTEEMITQYVNDISDQQDEDLCVIDDAFDIDRSTTVRKKMLRPKRRKHLFRYSPDISVSCWLSTVEPKELLLSCGYSADDVEKMAKAYPKLLSSSPKDMIAPKLRFLVSVLGGGKGDIGNGVTSDEPDDDNFVPHNLQVSELAHNVPTEKFFGPRLETSIGPRHAYLKFHGDSLPFGKELMQLKSSETSSSTKTMPLLNEFLEACTKSPAEFAALCQKWESNNVANRSIDRSVTHTAESVTAMDNIFSDGIAPFARNQATPDLAKLGKSCTTADVVALLLDHGANYAEHDDWGSTILHWTAGTGNLEAMKVLIEKLEKDEEAFGGDPREVLWSTCASCSIAKDGATPLHWAACGVSNVQFGCGGHQDVCQYLIDKAADRRQSLVNAVTSSGNSPLMWACWSGSIDVAKLLVTAGADPQLRNENGIGIAHWAACSGNVDICKYLHSELNVEFQGEKSKDKECKTPIDVALSFGHSDVVEWIASMTPELRMDEATEKSSATKEVN